MPDPALSRILFLATYMLAVHGARASVVTNRELPLLVMYYCIVSSSSWWNFSEKPARAAENGITLHMYPDNHISYMCSTKNECASWLSIGKDRALRYVLCSVSFQKLVLETGVFYYRTWN